MHGSRRSLGTLALLALVAAGILLLHEPPAPLPADAPPERFSAGRAMADVEAIAREPHPPGSPAHARVRDHVVERLRAVGLEVRVERAVATRVARGGGLRLANVENIVATRPGTAPTGTLVLAAHYDSHATGPGAGDDAAAVAALVEAVRALGDAPSRNTLTVLVTDAEEYGLLGAQAWADALGEAERQGMVVLNFEARGGGGPVFMFETSDGNERLVRAFAAAAPRPHASSLMYALYKTLPNDTDLTVFKRRGLAGLNFAFVGRWRHYHTALDTPANLDRRSLQHHGASALALSRRLLAADLAPLAVAAPADGVYFDLAGRVLVHYPVAWVWPLTLLAVLAFGALSWRALAEPRGPWHFVTGMAAAAATVAAGAVVGFGFGPLLEGFRAGMPHRDPCGARAFEGALAGSVLAVTLLGWGLLARRIEGRAGILGALAWWVVLLVAASALLPGGTYLLLWPLAAALAGLAPGAALPAAAAALLFLVPFWHSLSLLLGFSIPAVLGGLAALAFIPLLPALRPVLLPRSPVPAGAALLVAAAAFAAGATRDGPRVSTLAYVADLDSGETLWQSLLPADAWTGPLLENATAASPGAPLPLLTAPAPAVPLPDLAVRHESGRLVIDCPPGTLELRVTAAEPLEGLALGDTPLPATTTLVWIAPPQAVELALADPGRGIRVQAALPGLPGIAPPRPEGFVPAPVGTATDCTLLRRALERGGPAAEAARGP